MRNFNNREKEILKNLVKFSETGLENSGSFFNKTVFTNLKRRALILLPPEKKAIFYIDAHRFSDEKYSRKELHEIIETFLLLNLLIKENYISFLAVKTPTNVYPYIENVKKVIQINENNNLFQTDKIHLKPSNAEYLYSDDDIIYKGIEISSMLDFDLMYMILDGVLFVSEDLRFYVNNDFKSKEESREIFNKNLSILSLILAIILGLFGIYNPFKS